jgi:hypothetical protein
VSNASIRDAIAAGIAPWITAGFGPRSLQSYVPILSDHESRGGFDRFEILDVQIVHAYFDAKSFLDECHELHGKQGIDDAALKKVIFLVQALDVNRTEDEVGNSFLYTVFDLSTHDSG